MIVHLGIMHSGRGGMDASEPGRSSGVIVPKSQTPSKSNWPSGVRGTLPVF